MELIDSHCHIHFNDYPIDKAVVLDDAQKAGVTRIICVGCSLNDSQLAIEFASRHENVWATAGAHPHDGADYLHETNSGERLRQLLKSPEAVAIGEIGLDYYHARASRQEQEKSLRQQIEIGLESDKPFVFHVRDAWEDFWKVYDSYGGLRGVVHSFTAHQRELDQIISRGLFVSLNGIMTFTKDEQQLAAAKTIPLDKLLLETDAPFLTPKPDRGKPCQPKHVRNVAEFLAQLRQEDLEELAAVTTKNAVDLFKL